MIDPNSVNLFEVRAKKYLLVLLLNEIILIDKI